MIGELRGAGVQYRDFAAAAAEGAGTQVDHERPVGKNHRESGREYIDHDQPGKGFGEGRRQHAVDRRRRCRAGHRRDDTVNRHATPDTGDGDIESVLAVAHRRNNRADVRLAKRFFGELAGAAGDLVEDIDDRIDVLADGKIGADRLLRATQQAVGCIDVELEYVGQVGGHAAACEPGDVRQLVGQAGKRVEIGQRRRAIKMCIQVQRLHRRAAGTEVNPLAADFESVLLVAAVEDEGLAGAVDNILDHIPGEAQPPHLVDAGAAFERLFGQRPRRLAHAELGQHAQRSVVDLPHLAFGEGPVLAADRSGRRRVDRRRLAAFG